MTIYGRDKIGTPQPPVTRPRLRNIEVLLAHHVGVATSPNGRYRSADPARVLDDARAIAAYGIGAGVPWEYAYLIGLNGDIFEQAGDFRGAHCLNFNDRSVGVCFVNAIGVPVTAAQVGAWHRLRSHLVAVGTLTAGHSVAPHYRYRTTQCCGIMAEPPGAAWSSPTGQGRLGRLIPELITPVLPPPVIPPPNPPIETEDPPMYTFRHPRFGNVFLCGAGPATNVSSKTLAELGPLIKASIVDAHAEQFESCVRQSQISRLTLSPEGTTVTVEQALDEIR